MKTFVIILLFGCMMETVSAQDSLTQKVNTLKGLGVDVLASGTDFNFRMASAILNNKKQEKRIVKSLTLSATEIERIKFYVDYVTFHAPCASYYHPQLLNLQLSNVVIGPLESTK